MDLMSTNTAETDAIYSAMYEAPRAESNPFHIPALADPLRTDLTAARAVPTTIDELIAGSELVAQGYIIDGRRKA
jgi:hypothetical protein